MVNKIWKNIKNLLFESKKEDNYDKKLNSKIKLITEYTEYNNILETNKNIPTVVILLKEECDDCNKSITIANKLYANYLDKINIIVITSYKDNTKNNTSSIIFGIYDINYVPTYLIIKNGFVEKIKNNNYNMISKKIDYYINKNT